MLNFWSHRAITSYVLFTRFVVTYCVFFLFFGHFLAFYKLQIINHNFNIAFHPSNIHLFEQPELTHILHKHCCVPFTFYNLWFLPVFFVSFFFFLGFIYIYDGRQINLISLAQDFLRLILAASFFL